MLHEFILANRQEIIRQCRDKAVTRLIGPVLDSEVDHGVPMFLDQLAEALRFGHSASPEISRSAIKHGRDLLRQGFTVSEVVHAYGNVCQVITGLAVDASVAISTDDFRMLNRCLDDAIAGAVTEYGRERQRSGVEGESARGNERLGFFAHELRNLLNTAMMAFDVIKTGDVGVGGITGTVLLRSLVASRTLISRSLAEVRLTQGIQNRERFALAGFIEEVAEPSRLDANARGVNLSVAPVDTGIAIEGDRQILAALVANLLQNALKFTRPGTTVTLKTGENGDRVLIEVHDMCGGLPSGHVDDLFRPFEQRGADRTGMGLGLAFSRWAAEANDGRLYARDLPTKGCVFTVDLPRVTLIPTAAQTY